MALVVGTILVAVNQGSQLLAGEVDLVMVLRALASYALPYVVSSIGIWNIHYNYHRPHSTADGEPPAS